MKKLLLSLLMIVGYASMALADEAVFDFVTNDYDGVFGERGASTYVSNGTVSESGVTLSFTSSSGLRLWSDGLRLYKNKSAKMKVTAPGNISKIVILAKDGAAFTYFTVDDVTTGELYKGVYTADENAAPISEITFAYNDKGNYAISKVTVTYTPSGLEAAGLAYSKNELTAILGHNNEFPTLANPNNLAVTYSSSNEAAATVATDGAVTLVAPGTTTITASSEATATFDAGKASYTLTVVKAVNNLAEFIAATPNKGDAAYMAGAVQVVYVNGAYVYVKDATASSLIYGYNLGFKAGDIIPGGWTGKNAEFNQLYEIAPVGTMPAATEGEAPEFPVFEGTPTLDNVNTVVTFKNITFAEATPEAKASFTGTRDDLTLTFFNNFEIKSTEAGTYDVQGVITRHKETLQITPIEFLSPAPETYSFEVPDADQFENVTSTLFLSDRGSMLSAGETVTGIEPGAKFQCRVTVAKGYTLTEFKVGDEIAETRISSTPNNQYMAEFTINSNITANMVSITTEKAEPAGLTYRRKYTDGSSRYYNEISYNVLGTDKTAYKTADPTAEPYYVTPVNGEWKEEGAYIDLKDKLVEIPVNAEEFTMILKGLSGTDINWSQSCVYVDWNKNGSFIDAGETNGVINRDIKPNAAGGGMVITEEGERDEITLPADLKEGDTFPMLICLTEPKGVDGDQDLWNTGWEWSTEIFSNNVCSLINGQAYELTVKIIAADYSAISGIGVDGNDAPVEYYNLQGIRVNADQLVPGIYVVRQGNKTAKVFVK